jgi:MFS family permease
MPPGEGNARRAVTLPPLHADAHAATLAPLQSLARQLAWLRVYALLTYPFACVPFLFLWFVDHGMDERAYGEIIGAYYLAMFVAEVPTGVLSDRFGKQPMLVLGPVLLAAGFAVMLVAPGYSSFLAGEVLLGLGHAVLSGPPQALLYESLRMHGAETRFLREEARIGAMRLLGTGGAFLLGGLLARSCAPDGRAWHAAIAATCVLCTAAALVATRLHAGPPREPQHLGAFARAVAAEVRRPAIAWLLAYWVVLFALLRFPFHDYQPWLQAAGTTVPLFADPLFVGCLFAAMNFAAAPLSALVPALVRRCGRPTLFWAMPLVLGASLLVMAGERALAATGGSGALVWLGLAMFFVQQAPFGMHQALLAEFVNHRIAPSTRTTVLSALSLGARAVYAGLNVALFTLQDARGMAMALAVAGAGGIAAAAVVLWARPRGVLRGAGPID